MTPKHGDLDNAELFDTRGRLIVPKAILATLDAVRDLQSKAESDYRTLQGLPCKQTPQQPCPTQQVTLPDSQSAQDVVIGQAVRWGVVKAWTAIPHIYRTIIVLGGGAGLGEAVRRLILG